MPENTEARMHPSDPEAEPQRLADAGADTLARYEVAVDKPGYPTVRIGPFEFKHTADSFAHSLTFYAHTTQHPDGTTATARTYDPEHPHTPLPPRDPWALAQLMDNETPGDGTGANYPDLYSRLHALVGYTEASKLWQEACAAYDYLHSPEEC